MNIGQYARSLILENKYKNAEILKLVLQKFPDAKTTAACIAWYQSDIRKKAKATNDPELILGQIKLHEAKLEELKRKYAELTKADEEEEEEEEEQEQEEAEQEEEEEQAE